jgi:hypothetical protein
MQAFNEDGLSFDYPEDWRLEREPNDDGWAVTVQSPGTAFMLVQLDRSLPPTEEMIKATLEAMQQDYPALEAAPAIDTLAGEMAIGHDIEFFSLDTANVAWTRSFYGMAGTVLVLCQVSGLDEQEYEPALRAMCASMRSEE